MQSKLSMNRTPDDDCERGVGEAVNHICDSIQLSAHPFCVAVRDLCFAY